MPEVKPATNMGFSAMLADESRNISKAESRVR
jgi:hypothetical protein